MTPHPKRKHSKGRRDRRRAHDALAGPQPGGMLELRLDASAAHGLRQLRPLPGSRGLRGQERKEEPPANSRRAEQLRGSFAFKRQARAGAPPFAVHEFFRVGVESASDADHSESWSQPAPRSYFPARVRRSWAWAATWRQSYPAARRSLRAGGRRCWALPFSRIMWDGPAETAE